MPFRTKLTDRLGIAHPVLLAPMNAFSGGALAGAVSQAGGLGLTLTAAKSMVYYSRNFNWSQYEQSSDRFHRIGQTRKVTVYHLMAENTIDVKIDEALKRKEEWQNLVLSGAVKVEELV